MSLSLCIHVFQDPVKVSSSESITGLQSRTGQVLRQLYDEAVHNIPKTSHTGDPPGTKRPRAPKAPGKPSADITINFFCCSLYYALSI